jgi:hypothetical protein
MSSQMTPPVVWVLKAKTKWVMPLRIMSQPKRRVTPTPEIKGTQMAKRPAMMSRTLRAIDQLIALGTRLEKVDGVALMMGPP